MWGLCYPFPWISHPHPHLTFVLLSLSAVISIKINTWRFIDCCLFCLLFFHRAFVYILRRRQFAERINTNDQPSSPPWHTFFFLCVFFFLLLWTTPPPTHTHTPLPPCLSYSFRLFPLELTVPEGRGHLRTKWRESADSCVHTLSGGLQLFTPLTTSALLRLLPPSLPVPFSSTPAVRHRCLSFAFSHRDCMSASLHLC